MGVTVFNDKYVRVTRAWNKQETQIYVPIKKSLKAAIKEAEAIDRKLEEQQNAWLAEVEKTGERFFHDGGRIVGLRIVTRHRDGRKPSNEITLRVKVPNRDKPFFSNVSLDKHGFDQAFKLAVDKICEWNKLDAKSGIRQKLLAAAAIHKSDFGSLTGKAGKASKAAKAPAKPARAPKAASKPAKAAAKAAAKPAKATKAPARTTNAPAKSAKASKAASKSAKVAPKAAKSAKAPTKAVKATKAAAKPVKAAKPTAKAAKPAKAAAKPVKAAKKAAKGKK